jgi:cyclic pyranopterin phosphate synthase
MADRFRIDDHKLMLHPHRVAQWLDGRDDWSRAREIYPIYLEISPFGACNHRCIFCAVDYLDYRNVSQDPQVLRDRVTELAAVGAKAIMFSGEGEPTLWPHLPALLDHCTAVGIETALTTNAVPLNEAQAASVVRNCAWVKASINAGTAETYSRIHRTKPADFARALDNLARCVALRAAQGSTCTIGGQMLLLPENAAEAVGLARELRDRGLDYLVLKPYSQHRFSTTHVYEAIDYTPFLALADELARLETDRFQVVFRRRTMQQYTQAERHYGRCQATPFFWAYIQADGSVYGCSAFLGNEAFCYGNLNQQSFVDIWQGDRRRRSFEHVRTELDVSECRRNCRMDRVNQYLWQLAHPDRHASFI